MSVARKQVEAMQATSPSTPTKKRIPSLTPIPIPGISRPRQVNPSQPWSIPPSTINHIKVATPNKNNMMTEAIRSPAIATQPTKGILKTPERLQSSNGNLVRPTSQDTKRGPSSY
ncbi:hypothetical protein VTI74DRAFT_9594 [Chaetomium olivicolor]